MNFKIEKKVKIPNKAGGPGRDPIYPFRKMEIGDSFLVSPERGEAARMAAYAWGWRNKKKFAARTQKDRSVRIWRIE